ncbi:efflux RND transporter periplasmic adaptor subunit [Alkalimonas sp. MEB004]|uniref:Efflux RND transporter periplasmic adaptor subunit n=2 Tax=Alkalimonas mucilaginosa TaxID=3057676 RepID=A0ABU7JCB3_9GAMM|nr:efflux RND transporter periplasmic adaptor subunit [Alkalimonas sp. MEB004]MEE2022795.1 efflux RND transporter periplasmic adaptor subunit [Alkalimonas sp. MEB004]
MKLHRATGWKQGGLLLLFMLLTGCESAEQVGSSSSVTSEARTIAVAAAEVQHRDLSRRLLLSATVRPLETVRISAQTRGIVRQLLVEEGDHVRSGQLLLSLDQAEQRAELARAEALLEQARLAYRRQAELYQRELTSSSEYQAQAAALRVAESEYQLWQTRVAFGTVLAPRDAVVSRRWVELGESIREQDPLLELTDVSQLVLHLGVSELDVAYLTLGQQVEVQLDAMPGRSLTAQIRRIFPTAELSSRFITVEVALPKEAWQQGVRPGFLGRVNLMIDPRQDALAVPVTAVVQQEEGAFMMVIANERLEKRAVQTGVQRGQWLEITEGVEAGEVVLAALASEMTEGQRVRIVGWRG